MANGKTLTDRITVTERDLSSLTNTVTGIQATVNSLRVEFDAGLSDLYKRIDAGRREDQEVIRQQLKHLEDHQLDENQKVSKNAIYKWITIVLGFATLVLAVGGIYTNSVTDPLKTEIGNLKMGSVKCEGQLEKIREETNERRLREITKLHEREIQRLIDDHNLALKIERQNGIFRDYETQLQGLMSNINQSFDWEHAAVNALRERIGIERLEAPAHRFSVPDPRR